MMYRDMPLGVQKLIEADYAKVMRENFHEVEGEVMHAFLAQDEIQTKWREYRDGTYAQHLYEAERDGAWDEFLQDKLGLDG